MLSDLKTCSLVGCAIEDKHGNSCYTQAMCADINVGTDRVGGSVLVEADCTVSQIFALSVCLPFSLSTCLFVCMLGVCFACVCVCVNVVGGSLAEPLDEAGE